jgi:hypothetical protein
MWCMRHPTSQWRARGIARFTHAFGVAQPVGANNWRDKSLITQLYSFSINSSGGTLAC